MTSDWDPKPSERTYYRSAKDGQRAYLVRRDGKDFVRLDRPMQELLHPLTEGGEWKLDAQNHPLSAHQAAKIAFVADREVCVATGEYLEAKVEWINVPEKERIRFMKHGPDVGGLRDRVHAAIIEALREATGG